MCAVVPRDARPAGMLSSGGGGLAGEAEPVGRGAGCAGLGGGGTGGLRGFDI